MERESMSQTMKKFPLLNEIDEQRNYDDIDWNKNAFQTLLTSNLPTTTILYYAIDVGFRQLENSLYEVHWDSTADALNDLCEFLFNTTTSNDIDSYLYEAKCQLLMYASIAFLKLSTIRRRAISEAKLCCAATCLLLLEQSKSYDALDIKSHYSTCIRSMRLRYLKRIFIIGQWLPTLSKIHFDDIESNHEQLIETMIDHLFPSVSLRNKINQFIDHCLLSNNNNHSDCGNGDFPDNDITTSGFVFIRRFPKFKEKTVEKHSDLIHMGLINTLNQLNKNNARKLICLIWTLCCMIETDRVSLGVLNRCITREHFSTAPIDFEQKPITIESLSEQDAIVFLLLCAQQNVRLQDAHSTLHPYLLYSSSHLCTSSQKHWWLAALDKTTSIDFVNQLALIRLDEEQFYQYPPNMILLETARILFKTAHAEYEQDSNHSALLYEQYAMQYYQTAKRNIEKQEVDDLCGNKNIIKSFFFYIKIKEENKRIVERLCEECKKLSRQCDEIKSLTKLEPFEPLSPNCEETDVLSPVRIEVDDELSSDFEPTLFVTPPSSNNCNVDFETIGSKTPLPITTASAVEEQFDLTTPSIPPFVDAIFSHMNGVNQWINRFCTNNEGIQNDIGTIRDHLDQLNRATTQMIFSNVKLFQSNASEDDENCHSSDP